MSNVFLKPANPSSFSDGAVEPQYVTSRRPVSAWLYLASTDAERDVDKTKCVIGGNGILASRFSRFRVNGFSCLWNIPNVNPRNNTFKFRTLLSPTVYTFTLTEAWYDRTSSSDVTALAQAIIDGMNAAGSPLTFTKTIDPRYPATFTIANTTSTGFEFLSCDAVDKGVQMYGLDADGVATTHQLGPMNMMYTQYIDIKSDMICKFAKMRSVTSGSVNPIILRAYVGGIEWGSNFHALAQYTAFNWDRSEPLYKIDVSLYDQNGDQLYCPNGGKDFIWQLNCEIEV